MINRKRIFTALSLLLALLFALSGAAFAEGGEEKVEVLETALDYSDRANWAYFAEGGEEKSVDVFLIAPLVDTKSYANSLDLNEKLKGRFLSALDAQRGIYDDACKLYSPYYRQVSLNGCLLEEADYEQAMKNAYMDTSASFRWYLDHENNGRPIVLAGFSQGAQMCVEILKEFYGEGAEAKALKDRLVTVYALGNVLLEDDIRAYPQIVPAKGEGENGTVICFDCEDGSVKSSLFVPEGKKGVSINPLNWKTDSTPAGSELNKGALINGESLESLCGCYIDENRGTLIVTGVSTEQYPNPLPQLFEDGSFHTYDYMFFYTNLKENLELRMKNYDEAAKGQANAGLDIRYLLSLQSIREKAPWLGKLGEVFCELNALLLPALCVFIYLAVNKRIGRIALFNYGASELANLCVKNLACVPRPYQRDSRIVPVKSSSSYSMPSGHTMYAASIYGSIGAWQKKRHPWITALCIALILLTGFARNFVGAHTPQDVIVSIILTFAVMLAMTHAMFWLEKNPERTGRFAMLLFVFGLVIAFISLIRLYAANEGNVQSIKTEVFSSLGRWLGLLLALVMDTRIRYEAPKGRALRFGAGILGALIVVVATLVTNKLHLSAIPSGMIWMLAYAAALVLLPAVVMKHMRKETDSK